MNIQLIKFRNNTTDERYGMTLSVLSAPKSLDEFDLNIIDLSDENIWKSQRSAIATIDCIQDFVSLGTMIVNRTNSSLLFIMPQNIRYQYGLSSRPGLFAHLKNHLPLLSEGILKQIIPEPFMVPNLCFENTRTIIEDQTYEADFYFTNGTAITESNKSKKPTTVSLADKLYATTLKFLGNEQLMHFINYIFDTTHKTQAPEWANDISFFDDNLQKEIITENEEIICRANDNIIEAEIKLKQNEEFKSILYTNGDALVKTVFKILQDILSYDLSAFCDEKKEDFLIKLETITFVGEIKGVTSNVKSEHVSQVDTHYYSYLDRLAEENTEERTKQLLIINPLRNKPLAEREPVHDTQIELAKRNECLIVETSVLLRLYEKFLKNEVNGTQCVDLFSTRTGILALEDLAIPM